MRQRGVRDHQVIAIANFADLDVRVSRHLHAMRLSRRALAEAASEGLSRQQMDQLRRLAIVEAADGSLVTVVHLHGRKSKAYRRRDRRNFWG